MTTAEVREVLRGIRDDKTGEHRGIGHFVAEYLLGGLEDLDESEDAPNEVAASWLDAFDEVCEYVRGKLGVAPAAGWRVLWSDSDEENYGIPEISESELFDTRKEAVAWAKASRRIDRENVYLLHRNRMEQLTPDDFEDEE